MRRFENTAGGASKFWAVELKGDAVTTTWGKIGSDGQSKTKSYASPAAARTEHDKLIREKTAGGYLEVKAAKAVAPAKSAAPAKPAAPKKAAPVKAAAKGKGADPLALHTKVGKYGAGPLDVSPDGKRVAAGAMPLHVLDPKGKLLEKIELDDPHTPRFAPDGMLYTEHDGAVHRVWKGSVDEVLELPQQTSEWFVTANHLVAVAYASFVVFDRATGKPLVTKPREGTVFGAAVSPDGKTVAVGGDAIELWSTANGAKKALAKPKAIDAQLSAVSFTPDGSHLLAFYADAEDSGLASFDAASGKLAWARSAGPWFAVLDTLVRAFALDAERVVVGGGNALALFTKDGGLEAGVAIGAEDSCASWCAPRDVRFVACAYKESFLRVYDTAALAAGGLRAKPKPLG